MTDNVENLNAPKTPLQIAREELAQETSRKAVVLLKSLLKQKASAELVVKNVEREIVDTQERIAAGDVE